jgi:co-chaperonin GroES (HSP10)
MDIQKVRRSIFASEARVLRPLGDTVLVTDMNFEFRTTTSGIILPGDDGRDSGIRPRWGRVYAVGPDQRDVQEGQWILIDHGRWTRGVDIIDDTGSRRTIRKVDNKDILMVTDEPVNDDTMSDKVYQK